MVEQLLLRNLDMMKKVATDDLTSKKCSYCNKYKATRYGEIVVCTNCRHWFTPQELEEDGNVYALAKQFAILTADDSKNKGSVVKLAAGRKHRKQLEKDLSFAKDTYNRHRASLDLHEKAHSDLSSVIDKERKEVARHREEIMRCYDVMRNMDIHNIQEVRFMNDDVGYVKGKRLFRLDENQALVPFKRRKPVDELDMEEGENMEDEFSADDLLASLVE